MEYTKLRFEVFEGVALLTLDRPQIGNKLDIPLMEELRGALDACARDGEISAIVLAGGREVFCLGGELGDFRKKEILEIKDFGQAFIRLHLAMVQCAKPIIAAVEGDAMGGGFSLVEACDLAVIAEEARLAIPEILDGLAPAMGLSGIFANLPKKRVMALGLLGESLTAGEALAAGMVNEIVPRERVLSRALEIGRFFTGVTPTGTRLFKELAYDMGLGDYERRLRMGQSMMLALFKSRDGREVLDAREEARAPVWREKV